MKRLIPLILLALTACSPGNNKTMDASKTQLMNRLSALAENGRIAYGHQDDLVYGHAWQVTDWENDSLDRSDVKDVCGKYPALAGFDLGGIELGDAKNLDSVSFGLIRKAALTHLRRGGMVTFSWHPRNPLTGGDAWDVSSNQVVKSILPGGEKEAEFALWLRRIADFFESLGPDAAVIFRPWHENLGSWFWWGGRLCTAEEYKALYRMTRTYFEEERGLRNLVWCYSPSGNFTEEAYMERYPGDDAVDLLGVDVYDNPEGNDREAVRARFLTEMKVSLDCLTALGALRGKPVCLSETGLEGIPDPTWWTETLYPAVKDYPICYLLTWRNACDRPGHFFGPWAGVAGAEDFKAFSELEQIEML